MSRLLVLLAISVPFLCSAKIVCEPGVNRFGDWTPCLKRGTMSLAQPKAAI